MMNLSYEFMPPVDVKIEPYVPETGGFLLSTLRTHANSTPEL